MKILHIVSGDGWGGLEQVVALLAEGVAAQPGFAVEALVFNEGRLADVLREHGVPVQVVSESEHSFLSLARATRRSLDDRQPDVVHAHRYKEILASALAMLPSGRGFVVTLHGLQPSAQLRRSHGLLIWMTLVAARLVGARFVAVSGELAARLGRVVGRGHVAQIRNPMPTLRDADDAPDLRRQFGWNTSRPLVGFVGRLEHVKGPDIFLDIAARAKTDAGFVVIGGGSLEGDLVRRATSPELANQVAFLGETPKAARFIRQFDVLALPSRHEGLPLVLLEAAASAVPVVAFDVGGVREVLADAGAAARLIAPGDVDAFSAALDELLLRDREPARRDAQRWRESVRSRFNLATVSAKYCEIYRVAARQP